jgi:hypothetical protein
MATEAVKTLINGYLAVWNEADSTARQQLLGQVWADEGHYTDPQSDGKGREALNQIITQFHSNLAGSRFALDGQIDHHHNFVRFRWTLTLADGSVIQGMDFGEIAAENRLSRIVGFF